MRSIIRTAACLFLCAMLVFLGGCSATPPVEKDIATKRPKLIATPAPTLENDPAALYGSILTDQRVVSLILEGYTEDGSMLAILDELKKAKIPCVFFLSGVMANEHPDVARAIDKAGFTIGNYGINAAKNIHEQEVDTIIHQFRRGQELIEKAAGVTPVLFRCNGTVYTKEVLQAASFVGLEAGVEPSVYLNHRSFAKKEDAQQFVQKLSRGAVISIKLGQALDATEYEGAQKSMEGLAIDPPPFLSDDMEDTIRDRYANIVPVVTWLLEELKSEGYKVVTPKELQEHRITMFDSPAQLDDETMALINPSAYPLPVTGLPLGAGEHDPQPDSALDAIVLVGDSITAGLSDYVAFRRQESPEYLGGAQFLTSQNLGVVSVLARVTAASTHPQIEGVKLPLEDALVKMGAKTVLLMPGLGDVRQYSKEKLIDSLKLLIYQIRMKNPGIQICLQSIPPGVLRRYGEPSNLRIFQYNLAVYKFCLQYGIPYIDVAYALRDEKGNLLEVLCIDPDTGGIHLNDDGCDRWIEYLKRHMPS